VFVEFDRAAREVLARNIAAVGLDGASVVANPVAGFLRARPPDPFDLVFADPPYELPDADVAEMLATLVARGWLTESAIVVVERPARSAEPAWPPGIALVTQRRYGDGCLWYGRARDG
jgi:16S rRNA (guanine966-N2)-methyltransferase